VSGACSHARQRALCRLLGEYGFSHVLHTRLPSAPTSDAAVRFCVAVVRILVIAVVAVIGINNADVVEVDDDEFEVEEDEQDEDKDEEIDALGVILSLFFASRGMGGSKSSSTITGADAAAMPVGGTIAGTNDKLACAATNGCVASRATLTVPEFRSELQESVCVDDIGSDATVIGGDWGN
jgi:hypothetical protein